jgi:hypothetical protein
MATQQTAGLVKAPAKLSPLLLPSNEHLEKKRKEEHLSFLAEQIQPSMSLQKNALRLEKKERGEERR